MKQVVCEVHDVDGRLQRVCELLESVGFDSVVREQQSTQRFDSGYVMFVPPEIRMHLVYATRVALHSADT